VDARPSDADVEWRILVLACRGLDEAGTAVELRELFRHPGLDTGELLDQALRHRVLGLLVHTVETLDLWAHMPANSGLPLVVYLAANERRNGLLAQDAQQVAGAIEGAGVPVAFTKGVVFHHTLYDHPGMRTMGDIDLMIRPADVATTRRVMDELGYVIGEYDWRSHTIGALSAQRRMMYRLSPDHLPHFMRLRTEKEAPLSAVDIAYSVTWHGAQWQVSMDDVLGTRSRLSTAVGGARVDLPTLTGAWNFLFAVLHVFREAWFERTIRTRDLTLGALADICRLWLKHGGEVAGPVCEAVDRYRLHDPVRWVTAHTDAVFGTGITSALGLPLDGDDPWLRSARSTTGQQVLWRGTIHDRLRRKGLPEFDRSTE
jgi:hypothetical protein